MTTNVVTPATVSRPSVVPCSAKRNRRSSGLSAARVSAVALMGPRLLACNAMGLFGGPRLVLVRGAEALTDDEGAAIAAYLADPAPDTVLGLFGGGGIAPDGALAGAVAAAGDV